MTSVPRPRIPPAVCQVVGNAIGRYYYSHNAIDRLFAVCGAPGEPPEGSCVNKSTAWLKRTSDDPQSNAREVLGCVLREFMEQESYHLSGEWWEKARTDVVTILARHGMSYQATGNVIAAGASLPARSLEAILRGRDVAAIEKEHQRALSSVSSDPAQAVTASSAILEALFKVYIEDEDLETSPTATIKPLWSVVQRHLGLDPAQQEDDDIKRILSGLTSVVDGIGTLRTHAGSAHGRGRTAYRLYERHALLAVNAAFTLVTFVLQTWDERSRATNPGQ